MAEAVGLVLAVVPLVVSAAELFSSTKTCLSRYIRFSEDVQDFSSELNIQATIYRSATQLLLMSYVGEEQAVQMVGNLKHPRWADPDVEEYIFERFSTCLSGFMDAVSLVSNRLVTFKKLSQKWNDIVEDIDKDLSISIRKRCRRIGKKISFACSKDRLESLLSSLNSRTQYFQTLVQQTERIQALQTVNKPSPFARNKIHHFAAVKDAAQNLYEAFGYACTKHTEHQAQLGLQLSHDDSCQIRFQLAFQQLNLQDVPENSDIHHLRKPLWLTVESTISGKIESHKNSSVLHILQPPQKRNLDPEASLDAPQRSEARAIRTKKTVTFHLPPSPMQDMILTPSALKPKIMVDPLPNLCSNENFCSQIQKILAQPFTAENRCVGYLDHSGKGKHLVYIDGRVDSVNQGTHSSKTMRSLSQILATAYRDALTGVILPQHERIILARQLAVGVLQFHATRWINDSWTSDDVLISGDELLGSSTTSRKSMGGSASPSYSYVSVSITKTTPELLALTPKITTTKASNWSPIRNRLIFNLGKLLLELAFQQPFHRLQTQDDIDQNQNVDNSDFFTAERLLFRVSTELGLRYAELVRKCIHCDFAQGFDLAETRLQESFYQHVIGELEMCERQALGL